MGARLHSRAVRIMSIYYTDDKVTLHHGDCLDVLATLPDASVDAVVTDPCLLYTSPSPRDS